MKLLPAPPQPVGLLPVASYDPDKERRIREWWEARFAEIDLKELLMETFLRFTR